jgi:hypothetical protein
MIIKLGIQEQRNTSLAMPCRQEVNLGLRERMLNALYSNPEGLSPTAELSVHFASKRIPHSFLYVYICLKEWHTLRQICHRYTWHGTKI